MDDHSLIHEEISSRLGKIEDKLGQVSEKVAWYSGAFALVGTMIGIFLSK